MTLIPVTFFLTVEANIQISSSKRIPFQDIANDQNLSNFNATSGRRKHNMLHTGGSTIRSHPIIQQKTCSRSAVLNSQHTGCVFLSGKIIYGILIYLPQ
jgi:hypothetical protein